MMPAPAKVLSNNFVFAPVRGRSRAKSFELVPDVRSGISMGMTIPDASPVRLENEEALLGWLGAAKPGDQAVYHRGFLAIDVAAATDRLTEHGRNELLRTAGCAMRAAEAGLVDLVQHRHEPGDYSYLIVARRKAAVVAGSIVAILCPPEAA